MPADPGAAAGLSTDRRSEEQLVSAPVPDSPTISAQTAANALCEEFLTNADRGDNAANDHLITEIVDRIRTRERDVDRTPTREAGFPPFRPVVGGHHGAGADHE